MKIILETKSMWDALRQLGNDAVVISLSMQYRGVFPTEYRGCAITSEKMAVDSVMAWPTSMDLKSVPEILVFREVAILAHAAV